MMDTGQEPKVRGNYQRKAQKDAVFQVRERTERER